MGRPLIEVGLGVRLTGGSGGRPGGTPRSVERTVPPISWAISEGMSRARSSIFSSAVMRADSAATRWARSNFGSTGRGSGGALRTTGVPPERMTVAEGLDGTSTGSSWEGTVGSETSPPGANDGSWRPRCSRSAFRRTRSAWASSMEEEWLLAPIPSDKARSRASLFSSPSSFASSYTRIFLPNC